MSKEHFGTFEGKNVFAYTLTNKNGMSIKIIEYGAILVSIEIPDGHEPKLNIILGYDTLEEYLHNPNYFGATVGRYANRIAKGKFVIDGVTYNLPINNGLNSLHGGKKGFDKVFWKTEHVDENSVTLSYLSPDGDQGYPGNLYVTATYKLTDNNELIIIFDATTDKTTPISLTNHSSFNLAGAGSGDIYDHIVTMIPDKYLELTADLVPTGNIKSVKHTIYDLTEKDNPKSLGEIMTSDPHFDGFDNCFVISDNPQNFLKLVTKVLESKSGRRLEVYTTQPGIQLYTGNFLEKSKIANDKVSQKHGGFCLETNNFPDGPNHSNFPNPFLKPGEKYHQETVYTFFF
uniref:Aldose 1-epimerase n=1 Tax=Panagrolaimus sp. ES5 TaxID=591445 RepID=A0AC34G6I7_9BILA